MANQEMKDLVLQTLRDTRLAALATVSPEGVPHAVTVVFAVDDDFNIYFVTREDTSKVANLSANPTVSLSIGATLPAYVQMRGQAEIVVDDELRSRMLTEVAKVGAGIEDVWPPVLHFGDSAYVLIRIVPDLIRVLDLRNQKIATDDPPFIEIL